MKKIIFLLFVLFFILLYCEKDTLQPDGGNFIYPLSEGNKWEYKNSFVYFNFDPGSLKNTFPDTIFSSNTVEILNKVALLDSIETYRIRETRVELTSFESHAYLNNQKDGLYLFAYYGFTGSLPKRSEPVRATFSGKQSYGIQEISHMITGGIISANNQSDSLFYENPSLKSLEYPLNIGARWQYRGYGLSLRADKKVISYEPIEVPAGKFYCYVLQWFIDRNNDGKMDEDVEFYDYVSDRGLVKRSFTFKNLILTDEQGTILGACDTRDEYFLVSFSINNKN